MMYTLYIYIYIQLSWSLLEYWVDPFEYGFGLCFFGNTTQKPTNWNKDVPYSLIVIIYYPGEDGFFLQHGNHRIHPSAHGTGGSQLLWYDFFHDHWGADSELHPTKISKAISKATEKFCIRCWLFHCISRCLGWTKKKSCKTWRLEEVPNATIICHFPGSLGCLYILSSNFDPNNHRGHESMGSCQSQVPNIVPRASQGSHCLHRKLTGQTQMKSCRTLMSKLRYQVSNERTLVV